MRLFIENTETIRELLKKPHDCVLVPPGSILSLPKHADFVYHGDVPTLCRSEKDRLLVRISENTLLACINNPSVTLYVAASDGEEDTQYLMSRMLG